MEPEITNDRYYYERWLGRLQLQHIWPTTMSSNIIRFQLVRNDSRGAFQSSGDCLSLCKSDVPIGVNFPMRHPCEYMNFLLTRNLTKKIDVAKDWGKGVIYR